MDFSNGTNLANPHLRYGYPMFPAFITFSDSSMKFTQSFHYDVKENR